VLLLSDPRFAAVSVADCGEPLADVQAADERVLLDERERNPSGAYPSSGPARSPGSPRWPDAERRRIRRHAVSSGWVSGGGCLAARGVLLACLRRSHRAVHRDRAGAAAPGRGYRWPRSWRTAGSGVTRPGRRGGHERGVRSMRTCGPRRLPRGAVRRTLPVQALREPALGGSLGARLDYLARGDAGGRATS